MRVPHAPLVAFALAAGLSCAGMPVSFPAPGGTVGGPTGGGTAVAADVVAYTNDARVSSGLPRLTANSRLMEAARLQAEQMASYEKPAHTISGAPYPTMESRLAAAGYSWSSAAENIAWNQQSAREAVDSWMNSPGHRANMLDPSFTEMGAAMAKSARGEPYWVQVFGRPR